jgi:site-specific DNA recombinase
VLGYDIDPHGSRLTINADEALQVRAIFKLYLDYNSLAPVVPEIHRRGWRTKQWVTRKGVTHGGKLFTKGRLFRLLKNPIYIGKINFQKQTYDGEHEAIVEAATWEKVQQILQRNGRDGGVEVRDSYGALLKGLLRCATCHAPMIRTQSTKDSRRCRQYVCVGAQQRGANCQTMSVPEELIKAAVIRQIRRLGSDSRIVARGLAKAEEQRLSAVADLSLECQAAQRELANLENELGTVTRPASRDQPMTDGMTNLQERIDRAGRRLTEISRERGSLEGYAVDDDGFRAELARFGPVWESLNSREQARIIRTLIEHVAYDGTTNKVTVSFRSARIREMCRGAAKKRRD